MNEITTKRSAFRRLLDRLVIWWRDYDWAVKFFIAMIAGSMVIALLFTAIIIFPVWLIDILTA